MCAPGGNGLSIFAPRPGPGSSGAKKNLTYFQSLSQNRKSIKTSQSLPVSAEPEWKPEAEFPKGLPKWDTRQMEPPMNDWCIRIQLEIIRPIGNDGGVLVSVGQGEENNPSSISSKSSTNNRILLILKC